MNASEGSVSYVTIPEEYYIFSEYHGDPEIGEITTAFIEHMNYCHSLGIYSPYPVSGIVRTDKIPGPEVYGYARIYTRILNKKVKNFDLGQKVWAEEWPVGNDDAKPTVLPHFLF